MCTSKPSCKLWDENMLLDARERQLEPVPRPAPAVRDPQDNGMSFSHLLRLIGIRMEQAA